MRHSLAGRVLTGALALTMGLCAARPSFAQGVAIVRDTEVENLLRDYTRPIFATAKVGRQGAEIVLVNDRSFNAFVADGRRIFVNTGALIDCKTPNEIIGVLAHETGHIAGGHLAGQRAALENAQTLAIVGMLLGVGAVGAAAASGGLRSGVGQAAPGLILGPQEIARRSLLSYQRTQEASADAAALKFLNATGQSAKGMITTFRRFAEDQFFSAQRTDPYQLSHPMAKERIDNLILKAEASPSYGKTDSAALQLRHDLMRAKLIAFTGERDAKARTFLSTSPLPAQYARAIQLFRFGDRRQAAAATDDLIKAEPNNPYFYELKGQIFLETGLAKEAVAPLRKAVALAPHAGLIRIMLGHALVSSGNPAAMDEALAELNRAVQTEREASDGYRYLAMAYAAKGQRPQADLAAAQSSFYSGDYPAARTQARRAQGALPPNSPGWIKAEDIATYKAPGSGE
jgi:predicted Zn-dependent protease